MLKFTIRRAAAPDWQSVRAVRLQALADAPAAFGATLEEDEARSNDEWRARVADPYVATFLAETAACDPIGLVVGAPHTDLAGAAGLFAMWVAPRARGHGVGSALVRAVVAWAVDEKYQRVVLDVADDNVAAMGLYEACGFHRTGVTGTLPPPRDHILEHQRERLL